MVTIYRASLDTRNFRFEAHADTPLHARVALLKGLIAHGKKLKLPVNWFEEMLPDVAAEAFETDGCYNETGKLV